MFGNRCEMAQMAKERLSYVNDVFKDNSRCVSVKKNAFFEAINNEELYCSNYNFCSSEDGTKGKFWTIKEERIIIHK